MITDGKSQGEPDDIVSRAAERVRQDEANKCGAFFAVGVEGANMERLGQIAMRTPVKLIGLNFVEMFVWLSRSTQAVSRSAVGTARARPARVSLALGRKTRPQGNYGPTCSARPFMQREGLWRPKPSGGPWPCATWRAR